MTSKERPPLVPSGMKCMFIVLKRENHEVILFI